MIKYLKKNILYVLIYLLIVFLPVIVLKTNTASYTEESVIIEIEAYMEDASEIEVIILPNNQEVISSSTIYEVTKNGDYEFIVKAKNGEESRKSITISQIIDSSSDQPYIPEGFKHVEGTEVDTGYTIIDKYGNEITLMSYQTSKIDTKGKSYGQKLCTIGEKNEIHCNYFL